MIIISLLLLFSPNYFKFSNVIFKERYGIIITFCSFLFQPGQLAIPDTYTRAPDLLPHRTDLTIQDTVNDFALTDVHRGQWSEDVLARAITCEQERSDFLDWTTQKALLLCFKTTFSMLSKRFSTQVENRSMKMLDSFLPRPSQPTIHSASKTASNAS